MKFLKFVIENLVASCQARRNLHFGTAHGVAAPPQFTWPILLARSTLECAKRYVQNYLAPFNVLVRVAPVPRAAVGPPQWNAQHHQPAAWWLRCGGGAAAASGGETAFRTLFFGPTLSQKTAYWSSPWSWQKSLHSRGLSRAPSRRTAAFASLTRTKQMIFIVSDFLQKLAPNCCNEPVCPEHKRWSLP